MNNKKITFIFSMGRKDKVSNTNFAREFFYSYNIFTENFKEVNLIEYKPRNNFYLKFLDKLLRKISKLPFYLDEGHNKLNFNSLINSDYIIFTNERLALSTVFIIKKNKEREKNKIFIYLYGAFCKRNK